jgi:hypothetical protein
MKYGSPFHGCVLLFAAVVLAQLPLGRLMRSKA